MNRQRSLRAQLLMWQLLIVLFVICVTLGTALVVQWSQLRDAYVERALGVAQSVADLPMIREAYTLDTPEEVIQPLAELIRESSGMTYVVVTDAEGIRFSHPNVERIGQRVSTDPSIALSGEIFTGQEEGTLGVTWRAKVPVFANDGTVMGQVSVGILDRELWHDLIANVPWQIAAALIAALVSTVGAVLTARIFHRRTLGLEPAQIAGLLEGREAILHGTRDGIVATDTRGTIVLVNDAAREMLQLAPGDDPVGLHASRVLDAALASQLENASSEEQLRLVGERRVLSRADPVAHAGQPAGSVLLLRDHTELHETLSELEGAQSVTEALHTQAHEFQNQLHVIGGLLELEDIPAARSYVARISQGGELSRLDATQHEDAELGALLLAKTAQARTVGVTLTTDGLSVWPSDGDLALRDDLLTVLANLIDNAIEAAATSDDTGRVHVTTRRDENTLTMTVDDSGPGIPDTLLDHLFEPGVSTKATSGTRGFGLPLVRRITQRLGGNITVREGAEGGTVVEAEIRLATSTDKVAVEVLQ